MELATKVILDLCGGEASGIVEAGAPVDATRTYRFDPKKVVSLVGMDISEGEQRATLEALGFTLKGDMAHPPSWRPDILGEADLVEEVARIASLTKLEGKPMRRGETADAGKGGAADAGGARLQRMRDLFLH